jgi:hypothetical protein
MWGTVQEKFINQEDMTIIFGAFNQIQGIRFDGHIYFVSVGDNHTGSQWEFRIEDSKIVDRKLYSVSMS